VTPHRAALPAVATYLLGLDEPSTRADFREHLTACSACRTEWLALRDLPQWLSVAAAVQQPSAGLDTVAWQRVGAPGSG
jgi:predicted anti-sigma-YlaC factor YlaD